MFVKEAAAAAFFPGGFGTLDEAFEMLTLVQTGKCDPIPIVFVDTPGGRFWKDLLKFLKGCLLKEKKISAEDLCLFKITHSAAEAVEEILHYYSNFHSIRYVGDTLALRVQRPITDAQLDYLNKNFKDVVISGDFERSEPLKEEVNQPDLDHLPRLIFKFNRINNGRLRQIIDILNNT